MTNFNLIIFFDNFLSFKSKQVTPWEYKSLVNWMFVFVLISTLYGWRISLYCEIHVNIPIKYSWDFTSFKCLKGDPPPKQRHSGISSLNIKGNQPILQKIETNTLSKQLGCKISNTTNKGRIEIKWKKMEDNPTS